MGKSHVEKCHSEHRSVVLLSFLLLFALLCLYFSSTMVVKNRVTLLVNYFDNPINIPTSNSPPNIAITSKSNETDSLTNNRTMAVANLPILDSCCGRYIYVHNLPSRFNDGVIKNCSSLIKWFDMCPSMVNSGLGPQVAKPEGVLLNNSWFATNQFLLEIIFRERMKQYECLTNDSSLASAIFVPFYAGLDVGRYLWDCNTSIRDSNALDIVKWLSQKPEWKTMWGRDHFFIGGRTAWDFHRLSDDDTDWGNKLMLLPESMNMTMLSIETTSWSNEFGIPYPTYFHPASDSEIFQWQNKMRSQKRRHLFAFAGAPRPTMKNSIRNQIMNQCLASKSKCKLLNCNPKAYKCDNPVEVIKAFKNSVFCLQPPGDSPTRRSTFDSILAGCIPVFFHPGSAYVQYLWHLPRNYTKYSVFIPIDDIKNGKVSIKKSLSRISKEEVLAMREEVIMLIPKIVYARSKLETTKDAFDVAVTGVLDRVEDVRDKIKEGQDPGIGFAQENSWKLKLSGTGREDEWQHFF